MEPSDVNKLSMAPWLEECIKAMIELQPQSCAFSGRAANGEVFTAYWNADATEKALFCHNIYSDVILDIVGLNKDAIQHMWSEQETEDTAIE